MFQLSQITNITNAMQTMTAGMRSSTMEPTNIAALSGIAPTLLMGRMLNTPTARLLSVWGPESLMGTTSAMSLAPPFQLFLAQTPPIAPSSEQGLAAPPKLSLPQTQKAWLPL